MSIVTSAVLLCRGGRLEIRGAGTVTVDNVLKDGMVGRGTLSKVDTNSMDDRIVGCGGTNVAIIVVEEGAGTGVGDCPM